MDVCTKCHREIVKGNTNCLQLSQTNGHYYTAVNGLPEGHVSQGWFDFCQRCATLLINKSFTYKPVKLDNWRTVIESSIVGTIPQGSDLVIEHLILELEMNYEIPKKLK